MRYPVLIVGIVTFFFCRFEFDTLLFIAIIRGL